MNANELADDLEKYDWYYEHEVTGSDGYTQEIKTCNTEYIWDVATMLRQQQAEIEALKKFSRWAYGNLTQTALQYELLGGRSEFDVNELWKLLEEKQ